MTVEMADLALDALEAHVEATADMEAVPGGWTLEEVAEALIDHWLADRGRFDLPALVAAADRLLVRRSFYELERSVPGAPHRRPGRALPLGRRRLARRAEAGHRGGFRAKLLELENAVPHRGRRERE